MKLINIPAIAVALLAMALPSRGFAKGKAPKDPLQLAIAPALNLYDKDSDHAISGDEIAAVRAAFDAEKGGVLKPLDANADGKLDDAEIAAIKKAKGGKGGKKKAGQPAA